MDYNFKLTRLQMYNQELMYSDSMGTVSAIVEDSPNPNDGLLVWENDFHVPDDRRKLIFERLQEWASINNKKITIFWNKCRC